MSSEGFIVGAVIVAVAIVVGAWLMSTTGYERCMGLHSGNVERCRSLYPPTAAPPATSTPAAGGPNR